MPVYKKKKPRIAILHYTCLPIIAGVEIVIDHHAQLFADHGYNVRIIAGRGKKTHKNIDVKLVPEIDSLHPLNRKIKKEIEKGSISKKFYDLSDIIYKKLKWILRDRDVCFIHNILTYHHNFPLAAALKKLIQTEKDKKFIAWCHDSTFFRGMFVDKKSKFPYSLISQPTRGVTYVTISNHRKRQFSKLFGKSSIRVVPDGVAVKDYLVRNQFTMEIYRKFKFEKQDFVILYPTRIIPFKKVDVAIKIVKCLNKLRKKSKLVVTGQPSQNNPQHKKYYTQLRNLIKKNKMEQDVIFLHDEKDRKGRGFYISTDIIRDFYQLSDFLLFTSAQEGFGMPVIEAGLFKLPIVCSSIPPLREIGDKNVLFININDGAMNNAEKIIKWMEKNQTSAMFKKVLRNYDWENIFKEKIEPLL